MSLRRWLLLSLLALGAVILVLYGAIVNTYFLEDDFFFVHYLHFHSAELLRGGDLRGWFVEFWAPNLREPDRVVYFRPLVQWLFMADYTAWQLQPFGYHLTNLLLYFATAFEVCLLAWFLTRRRAAALAAGLLFAAQPAHIDAAAWISGRTDAAAGLFYVTSVLFFILWRTRGRWLYYAIALAAFALALGAKEIAVTLPLVLLGYDALYGNFTRRYGAYRALLLYFAYWIILAIYLVLRWSILHQTSGFSSVFLGDPRPFIESYLLWLTMPLLPASASLFLVILPIGWALVLFLYRARRTVWFGLLWVVVALLPSFATTWPMLRHVYLPSVGVALLLAEVLTRLPLRPSRRIVALEAALVIAVLTIYGSATLFANADYVRAGQIAAQIPQESRALRPTVPPNARLFYLDVPGNLRAAGIYGVGLPESIQLAYSNPTLQVWRVSKFPIVSEPTAQPFYFEYRRGKLVERADVERALVERRRCDPRAALLYSWDFDSAAGWEAWNDVTVQGARDGALVLRAEGRDPYLGSPPLDAPTLSIGEIEIRMRVAPLAKAGEGALLWITAEDSEFVPTKQRTFRVSADGQFHTYNVNLDQSGNLFYGERITQLRLDPLNAPGMIELDYIRVYRRCA